MKDHPFQFFSAPSRGLSLILHILGTASFAYSFHFLYSWETPVAYSYGWYFQFLTILSLGASAAAFAAGLLADITSSRTLFSLKNAISTVATPLECLITILYWGLAAIDPTLVTPPEYIIPLDVDVSFHLAPAVFLVLDHLFFSPPWGTSGVVMALYSTLVGFSYWCWVEICQSTNGFYIYPLFGLLSTEQRVGLFVGSALVTTTLFLIIRSVHAKINGHIINVDWSAKNSMKKTN